MADIYCPICSEPWEIDSLHEQPGPFNMVYADFRQRGCAALGEEHGTIANPHLADASAEVMAVLGDDVDGAAAILEDWQFTNGGMS